MYHHLWVGPDHERMVGRWMARVAALLREQDLDVSSARVIEAVRLAETLAALRGRPLPGLPELNEAVQAVLCFGSEMPLPLPDLRLCRPALLKNQSPAVSRRVSAALAPVPCNRC